MDSDKRNGLQPQHMNAKVNGTNWLRRSEDGPLDGINNEIDEKYSV